MLGDGEVSEHQGRVQRVVFVPGWRWPVGDLYGWVKLEVSISPDEGHGTLSLGFLISQ